MKVTTEELKIQPDWIIDQVVNGNEVTVTCCGKALAKITPIVEQASNEENIEVSILGLWKERTDLLPVEDTIRMMRKGRQL